MQTLYTYSGKYFGYRDSDELWSHDGRHVGRFRGDEVYDHNGDYLGEIKNGKLITDPSKRTNRSAGFLQHVGRVGTVPSVDHVGSVMPPGYEDFPAPQHIRD